jgi:hypothetical protein
MFNLDRFVQYTNPILEWLYRHGWEGPGWGQRSHLAPGAIEPHLGPQPEPWTVAVGQLVQAASAKEVAVKLPEGPQRSAMMKSASMAIETVLDDWCGTPPRRHPWPWPGPPPWTWQIVSELTLVANSLQGGPLRDEILNIAGQLTSRANVPTGPTAAR